MKCLRKCSIPMSRRSLRSSFNSYNLMLHNQLIEVLIFKLLLRKLEPLLSRFMSFWSYVSHQESLHFDLKAAQYFDKRPVLTLVNDGLTHPFEMDMYFPNVVPFIFFACFVLATPKSSISCKNNYSVVHKITMVNQVPSSSLPSGQKCGEKILPKCWTTRKLLFCNYEIPRGD